MLDKKSTLVFSTLIPPRGDLTALRSGLAADQPAFSTQTPSSLSLRASLCAEVQAQWNRKGHPPTIGRTKRSKIAEFAKVFEFL